MERGHFIFRCNGRANQRGNSFHGGNDELLLEILKSTSPTFIMAMGNFIFKGYKVSKIGVFFIYLYLLICIQCKENTFTEALLSAVSNACS